MFLDYDGVLHPDEVYTRGSRPDWLAIDDNDDGWPDTHRHHLVHTVSARGLDDEKAAADLRHALTLHYTPKNSTTASDAASINRGSS